MRPLIFALLAALLYPAHATRDVKKHKPLLPISEKFVTVGGFVHRPGKISTHLPLTLSAAITKAGNVTIFGSIRRVELIRNNKRFIYDLRKTKHKGLLLIEGDVINVPQKKVIGR